MKSKINAHKADIIAIGKRIYEQRLIIATGGNISVRLDNSHFLITASGMCKGLMNYDDIVICDFNGKHYIANDSLKYEKTSYCHSRESGNDSTVFQGDTKNNRLVSSEVYLHTTVYKMRPDVHAVIHAHPPMAVACSLADIRLDDPLLPEIIMTLGKIPTTAFVAPSSPESAAVIRDLIPYHNAIILDRHGSVTVGKDIREAFYNLERLEFTAQVVYNANLAGDLKRLSSDELFRIEESAQRYKAALSEVNKK